jgi:hypothetical protein
MKSGPARRRRDAILRRPGACLADKGKVMLALSIRQPFADIVRSPHTTDPPGVFAGIIRFAHHENAEGGVSLAGGIPSWYSTMGGDKIIGERFHIYASKSPARGICYQKAPRGAGPS